MPIYAYRCASCGFERDHLQKLGDSALEVCPQCGQMTYSKQVTAAGFQLKGSGWYATDFKDGNKPPPSTASTTSTSTAKPESKESAPNTSSDTSASGASTCADS
ncbi:MAG: zinc ribbon domain-containing protein [Candidatus Accumulibacter sp.]|nr:zinc ribbon domain-containing protein [Accumulibacter sp.]